MSRSIACLAAALLAFAPAAMGQTFGGTPKPPPPVAPPGPKQPILCPPMLAIAGVNSIPLPKDAGAVPLGAVAKPGWNAFALQFEPYYPPEIRQGAMICHYRNGSQLDAYGIYQMVGPRRCFVRPDKRGFDCMR